MERPKCPLCGSEKAREVIVGMKGNDFGPLFYCGSIYWPAKDRVTVIGPSCKEISTLRARVTELEAQLAKLKEKNTKFRKRFREFAQYARYQDGRANSITELYIETDEKLADLREKAAWYLEIKSSGQVGGKIVPQLRKMSADNFILEPNLREKLRRFQAVLDNRNVEWSSTYYLAERDLRAALGEG